MLAIRRPSIAVRHGAVRSATHGARRDARHLSRRNL